MFTLWDNINIENGLQNKCLGIILTTFLTVEYRLSGSPYWFLEIKIKRFLFLPIIKQLLCKLNLFEAVKWQFFTEYIYVNYTADDIAPAISMQLHCVVVGGGVMDGEQKWSIHMSLLDIIMGECLANTHWIPNIEHYWGSHAVHKHQSGGNKLSQIIFFWQKCK